MSTGYLINNRDLDETFESFPIEVAEQYGVSLSILSTEENRFQINGQTMRDYLGVVFPTSAGDHIGGYNECNAYRINGSPIDVALKGCRPIGIPLTRLGAGEHYLNRIDNQTWLSSYPNSTDGIRLEYDPKCLHVEVLGGGGGGAGSGSTYASAGGGGGGYCYATIEIPDGGYIELVVGEKGLGGEAKIEGHNGGDSYILDQYGNEICRACGGLGGSTNGDAAGLGGIANGGFVNVNGGAGGKKDTNGYGVGQFFVELDKPEHTEWERGSTSGGTSKGTSYGGGGGASAFSNGANGDTNTTPSPAEYGAGGAGAGFKVFTTSNGGDGGEGFINLYY